MKNQEETTRKIIILRKNGMGIKEIAKSLGLSQNNVNKQIRMSNALIAREMYRDGKEIDEIAKTLNRAKGTIRKYLTGILKPNTHNLGKGISAGVTGEEGLNVNPIKEGTVKVVLGGNKNTVVYAKPGYDIEELKLKYGVV